MCPKSICEEKGVKMDFSCGHIKSLFARGYRNRVLMCPGKFLVRKWTK